MIEQTFLPDELRQQLLANGTEQQAVKGSANERDFVPVVKFFSPYSNAVWLLTELYPDDPDVAFGLCDLGQGFPELGDVRLSELEGLRGAGGLPLVERDEHFQTDKPLSAFTKIASEQRCIVTDLE